MNGAQRDRRIEELFALAIELERGERDAFLRRHCAGDPGLRAELEELLRQDDEGTKDFLASPVLAAGAGNATEAALRALGGARAGSLPERIGRYRLIEKLGEGGMGAVFLAEQERPVRREVALKIVKLGMDTERVVARFERERQALALMDHPGIARIFDAGATETGRPYFVMELVAGEPIHVFCRNERLSLAERLELFARVCEAVQHAHQKGIVHRDIKPTNVLVVRRDGRPEPKVIDFGIARAVASEDAGARVTREVIGTAYYMSPEQADPGAEVDTRTDIYALGVLLYELLTGVLPFDADELANRSAAEVQAFLRDNDPPPPSVRLARLPDGEPAADPLVRRGRRAWRRRIRGDLDWIALEALERDPARRYATASELAAEVRRFLHHEPVLAGPPDLSYRLAKFARRHRVGVLASAFVFAALVLGVIGTTWGMLAAADAADDARRTAREADAARQDADLARASAEGSRLRAEEEARQASAVTGFLVDTISLADAEVAPTPDLSLVTLLERAGERVGSTFESDPRGEVMLRRAIGQALHSLDDLERAATELERALEMQRQLPSVDDAELYATMQRLAEVYADADHPRAFAMAHAACSRGLLVIGRAYPALAAALGDCINGTVLRVDADAALDCLASLEPRIAEELPADAPERLVLADQLEFCGATLTYLWGETRAVPFIEAALAIRRAQLPPLHPGTARTTDLLVAALNQVGEYERAEELARESLAAYERALPEGHPRFSEARSLLGESLSGQGRHAEALDLLSESHAAILAARGRTSRAAIDASSRLVRHHERTGESAEAERYRAVLVSALAFARNAPVRGDRRADAFGDRHAELARALAELDRLVLERDASVVSEELYLHRLGRAVERVIELRRATLADDDELAVLVARVLAAYAPAGPARGGPVHVAMADEVLTVLGPHRERLPRPVIEAWTALAEVALHDGDPERAAERFRAVLEVEREVEGRCARNPLVTEGWWSSCLQALGRHDEAESELVVSWELCVSEQGFTGERTLLALENLVRLHESSGRLERLVEPLSATLASTAARDRVPARINPVVWKTVRAEGMDRSLLERAREAAERNVELAPDVGDLWNTLALARYRCGDLEGAIAAAERSAELQGDDVVVDWAVRAMASERLGRHDVALAALERMLAVHEDLDVPGYPYDRGFVDEARRVVGGAQALGANSIAPDGRR